MIQLEVQGPKLKFCFSHLLCGLGQVTYRLWAAFSLFAKRE